MKLSRVHSPCANENLYAGQEGGLLRGNTIKKKGGFQILMTNYFALQIFSSGTCAAHFVDETVFEAG